MIIREFQSEDLEAAKDIFALYFTDPEFLEELSNSLKMFVEQTDEGIEQKYRFFVAEENNEIVGVAGLRCAPDYLRVLVQTNNPAEFYITVSKYKNKGIGEALRLKRLEEAKELRFTEIVLYSPDSHQESWGFHDRLGFERAGSVIAPDGEPGQVWRMLL